MSQDISLFQGRYTLTLITSRDEKQSTCLNAIYKKASGEVLLDTKVTDGNIISVPFTYQGREFVVTSSNKYQLCLLNLTDGRVSEIKSNLAITTASVSPDGSTLAISGDVSMNTYEYAFYRMSPELTFQKLELKRPNGKPVDAYCATDTGRIGIAEDDDDYLPEGYQTKEWITDESGRVGFKVTDWERFYLELGMNQETAYTTFYKKAIATFPPNTNFELSKSRIDLSNEIELLQRASTSEMRADKIITLRVSEDRTAMEEVSRWVNPDKEKRHRQGKAYYNFLCECYQNWAQESPHAMAIKEAFPEVQGHLANYGNYGFGWTQYYEFELRQTQLSIYKVRISIGDENLSDEEVEERIAIFGDDLKDVTEEIKEKRKAFCERIQTRMRQQPGHILLMKSALMGEYDHKLDATLDSSDLIIKIKAYIDSA
jgi:hypothetical protein